MSLRQFTSQDFQIINGQKIIKYYTRGIYLIFIKYKDVKDVQLLSLFFYNYQQKIKE